MTKKKALEWIVATKAISPFTRSFIFWLYENAYLILDQDEAEEYKDFKYKKSMEE